MILKEPIPPPTIMLKLNSIPCFYLKLHKYSLWPSLTNIPPKTHTIGHYQELCTNHPAKAHISGNHPTP